MNTAYVTRPAQSPDSGRSGISRGRDRPRQWNPGAPTDWSPFLSCSFHRQATQIRSNSILGIVLSTWVMQRGGIKVNKKRTMTLHGNHDTPVPSWSLRVPQPAPARKRGQCLGVSMPTLYLSSWANPRPSQWIVASLWGPTCPSPVERLTCAGCNCLAT